MNVYAIILVAYQVTVATPSDTYFGWVKVGEFKTLAACQKAALALDKVSSYKNVKSYQCLDKGSE